MVGSIYPRGWGLGGVWWRGRHQLFVWEDKLSKDSYFLTCGFGGLLTPSLFFVEESYISLTSSKEEEEE
jgi:hypothetical protein